VAAGWAQTDRVTRPCRTRALALLLAAAVLGLVGCGRSASVGAPRAVLSESDRSLVGPWTDAVSGQPLPDGTQRFAGKLVVATSSGSTTCSESQGTVFLHLAWPLGTTADAFSSELTDGEAPQFVRDTRDSAMETVGSSDLDVALPSGVRRTGFTRNGNVLSVDPRARAVYVTRPDGTTERWARLRAGAGCA
jgi:hypothetical protein